LKRILITAFLVLTALMVVAVPTFAADPPAPTSVQVNWTGGGVVGGTVVNGGVSTTTFNVAANGGGGTFTSVNNNDNPYNYGISTTSAYINGTVANGGMIDFQTVRNASQGMYGPAGQTIYAGVSSDTGTAAIATGSATNYAEMTNGTYGKTHTAGGFNFEAASGTTGGYQIVQTVSASNAIAQFVATGLSGAAQINSMTTGAYGANAVNLGWGGGCYTNATALFSGAGQFAVTSTGANSVSTPIAGANGAIVSGGWVVNGNGSAGSASLQTIANFVNGASVGNFSVSVR
jgi:hypothetical protein